MKSIKTIFNEVYSEGLAEYGFKKVQGKYPYFARMVGEEIIQVMLNKYYEKEMDFKEKLIHSAENENIRETRIERMEYIQSVLEERRQRNTEELRRYKLL